MSTKVDSRMTFATFVVGPENRLAWEAARTTAESPGAAYNPLFIYSDTGLGKTHLLIAIANRARELAADVRVVYTPLERVLRRDGEEGEDASYGDADILLIDDLQFLGRRREDQKRLFHLLDHLLLAGRQVVLACDRPPLEMGELDDRLLSRFSGGLVVDIGRPNLQTRRAILELRLQQIGVELKPEILDAIARLALENVRQLQGALHRVLATRKAEGREITVDEVDRLLADVVADPQMPWLSEEGGGSEFDEFLDDVSFAVEEALASPKWREELARAILKWEAEGYSTSRLEHYLESDEPVDAARVVAQYERDISELESIAEQLRTRDPAAVEGITFKDPELLSRLRQMLADARQASAPVDDFFQDREKVVWDWPALEDLVIESWSDGD